MPFVAGLAGNLKKSGRERDEMDDISRSRLGNGMKADRHGAASLQAQTTLELRIRRPLPMCLPKVLPDKVI